jgi:hypothetical protein
MVEKRHCWYGPSLRVDFAMLKYSSVNQSYTKGGYNWKTTNDSGSEGRKTEFHTITQRTGPTCVARKQNKKTRCVKKLEMK